VAEETAAVVALVGAWIWPSVIWETTAAAEVVEALAAEVVAAAEEEAAETADETADETAADEEEALAEEEAAMVAVVGAWIWPSVIWETTAAGLEAELTEVVRVVALVTTEVMVLEEAVALELELEAAAELEEETAAAELEELLAAALEDEETAAVVAAVGAWIWPSVIWETTAAAEVVVALAALVVATPVGAWI